MLCFTLSCFEHSPFALCFLHFVLYPNRFLVFRCPTLSLSSSFIHQNVRLAYHRHPVQNMPTVQNQKHVIGSSPRNTHHPTHTRVAGMHIWEAKAIHENTQSSIVIMMKWWEQHHPTPHSKQAHSQLIGLEIPLVRYFRAVLQALWQVRMLCSCCFAGFFLISHNGCAVMRK